MRTILKALIATVVVGTSAIASAAPCNDQVQQNVPVTVTTSLPTTIAQAPTQYPVITHPIIEGHTGWVKLASDISLRGERDIEVGQYRGSFRRLQVAPGWGNGATKVEKVRVTFGDDQVETYKVDRNLHDKDDTVNIGFGQERFIKKIEVVGASRGNAIEVRAF